MEQLAKMKTAEIKGMSAANLRENEEQVRRELAMLRMNSVFAEKGKSVGVKKQLRKTLARILTQKSMNSLQKGA